MRRVNAMVVTTLCAITMGCATGRYGSGVNITRPAQVPGAILLGGDGLDWVRRVSCEQDGSGVLFGETIGSFGQSLDILALKITDSGRLLWAKTFGGDQAERLHRVIRTSDSGYVLVAVSESLFHTPLPGRRPQRPLIIKVDKTGKPEWSLLIDRDGESLFGELVDAVEVEDGGYVLVGQTRTSVGKDSYRWDLSALKLDVKGQPGWAYRYELDVDGKATSVAELSSGGIIVAGHTLKDSNASATPADEAVIVKIDQRGKVLSAGSFIVNGYSLQPFSISENDGMIFMSGAASRKNGHDILAFAADTDGELLWAKTYHHVMGEKSFVLSMAKTTSETFAIGGLYGDKRVRSSAGDYVRGLSGALLVINQQGDLLSSRGTTGDRDEEIRHLEMVSGRGLCIGINTESFNARMSDVLMIYPQDLDATPFLHEEKFEEKTIEGSSKALLLAMKPVSYRVDLLSPNDLAVKNLEAIQAESATDQ